MLSGMNRIESKFCCRMPDLRHTVQSSCRSQRGHFLISQSFGGKNFKLLGTQKTFTCWKCATTSFSENVMTKCMQRRSFYADTITEINTQTTYCDL